MPVTEPSWRKKRECLLVAWLVPLSSLWPSPTRHPMYLPGTPCPFYQTGRCIFNERCNFIHDGAIDHKQLNMRAAVPPYRRTPENSVDSFSSSEDDDEDRPTREPINEHAAAAPSLIFSSIYGRNPSLHPHNHLQLSEVDLPVSPESLPETPGRVYRRPSASSRASAILSLAVSSPGSSRAPSRPVSASLGTGLGGRGQSLAEVFTALATSQAQATALPPSSAGSLPSPLSLSPQSPPHGAQDVVIPGDNYTLEQFPFKLALSNQSSLLLNRTTRAAERENVRRGSSVPQTSNRSSPAAKQQSNHSAPDRFDSVILAPDFSFERPTSYSRSGSTSHHSHVPLDAGDEEEEIEMEEEEMEMDEEEEEQEIVKEALSFEALQPYPRDVSIEPSPDPAQEGFGDSTTVPDLVQDRLEDEDEPRRPPRRMDSDRKLDHERLLIELEERLNIDPSRRRARSATTTTRASQKSATVVERTAERIERERQGQKIVVPSSGVDMDAARGMLGAMFAKRGMGKPSTRATEKEEEEVEDNVEDEESGTFKDEDRSVIHMLQGDHLDLGLGSNPGPSFGSGSGSSSGSRSSGQSLSFLPADWDIGSLDLAAHPLGLDSADTRNGLDASSSPNGPGASLVPSDSGSSSVPLGREELGDWGQEEHTPPSTRDDSMSTPEPVDHDTRESAPAPHSEAHISTREVQEQEPAPIWERQQTLDIRESGHYSEWRHAEEQDEYDSSQSKSEQSDNEHDDEHLSHSDFSSEEEAEVQAVMESSVILRREVPRETSLPEARSRMGSLMSIGEAEFEAVLEPEDEDDEDEDEDGLVLDEDLTMVTNESLATTVPEEDLTRGMMDESSVDEHLVEASPETGWATAVPGKMVRAETVSASSLVFELPRIESASVILDVPDAVVEQDAHTTIVDERQPISSTTGTSPIHHGVATPGDGLHMASQDSDAITPTASRQQPPHPTSAPSTSDSALPAVVAPTTDSDARTIAVPIEPQTEAEPSKRRSQLKPLRLSMLYGHKTPTTASFTPISAHSPTPIAANFSAPGPQAEPYPTPATAHPTHAGSGTARSIPSAASLDSRAPSPLADVEEASESVSVRGVGRGSFGPESVAWFGSKKGSTRGSLGESIQRPVVLAQGPELPLAPESPTPEPVRARAPLPEFVTPPEDEDVRPLPVIWDDETEAGSRSGSGDAEMANSLSLPIPAFDVPKEDATPTAESVSSLQRYPAFVNTSPLPSPRFMSSARASPEPPSRRASQAVKPSESVEDANSSSVVSARATTPEGDAGLVRESLSKSTLGLDKGVEVEHKPETQQKTPQVPQPETEQGPRQEPRQGAQQQFQSKSPHEPSPELEKESHQQLRQEQEHQQEHQQQHQQQHEQEHEQEHQQEREQEREQEQEEGLQLQHESQPGTARPSPPARSRKWGDQTDDDSIGSLPTFDNPSPPANAPTQESSAQQSGRPAPRPARPHYYYPPLPDTAPLSISPRNITPSMMQREQEESLEQEVYHQRIPWATPPLTAPLHLQMKMRAQQRESASSPWMAEYFVNSPSSLHSSQMGSIHSASSSIAMADKTVGAEQFVVETRQQTKINSLKARTFGDPGPGPSTMMTYSARKQTSEALGSPISLRSAHHSRVASLINEPEPPVAKPRAPSRKTSREDSIDQNDLTVVKAQEELSVKISSEVPSSEPDPSPLSSSARHPRLYSPLRNTVDVLSPSAQTLRFKPLSSPNRRSPVTPLPDHSPLNILRRNLGTRPGSVSPGLLSPQTRFTDLSEPRSSRHQHHGSLAAPTVVRHENIRNGPVSAPLHQNRQSLTPAARFGRTSSRPGSPTFSVQSAVSQTKPLLFFAIAKNSAQEVERLLQEGEVEPNDKAGPDDLPALAFTLANEQLTDKTQIVKSLLSHGADPSSVLDRKSGSGEFDDAELALSSRIEQGINPAIRYYLNRKRMTIPAAQAELLEKNNFGALTRAGFSIVGQDAALDELIRVVAGHCRRQTLNPLVIVFSGGPGCGKSLLASKIGPLLHVPYFTINMTNLRNESSLWQYISMTTKPGAPQIPLLDFLKVNQGQRVVVVLEEIEKAADKTVWHSLLMPWEWGKATVIAPTTNEQIDIDTSQVIWIATSNSGDDATLKFFAERSRPSHAAPVESALTRLAHGPRPNDQNFTRKDYLQLMQAVRKRLGEILGSSMISRVSSVLPFLPFTEDEVLALASESLSAMREAQKTDQDLEDVDWDGLLQQAVGEYIPGEGARSVHRAVQRAYDEITEW